MSLNKAIKVINRIKSAYLFLTITAVLCFFKPSRFSSIANMSEFSSLAIGIVYFTLYSGLRYKREWTIPLILFVSAWSFIQEFIYLMRPAENIMMLLSKPVSALLILFFAYQMAFFSKREIRMVFGEKNKVIF